MTEMTSGEGGINIHYIVPYRCGDSWWRSRPEWSRPISSPCCPRNHWLEPVERCYSTIETSPDLDDYQGDNTSVSCPSSLSCSSSVVVSSLSCRSLPAQPWVPMGPTHRGSKSQWLDWRSPQLHSCLLTSGLHRSWRMGDSLAYSFIGSFNDC